MVKKNNLIAHFLLLIHLTSCSQDMEKFDDLSGAESLFRLGENMKNSGDRSSAIKLYHQALAIDPDYQAANLSLVDALKADGKFEECRSILDKLLLKDPEDEKVLNALGKVAITQNDGPGCLKSYQHLIKNQPENPNFLNGLAICHDILQRHDQAQNYYQKAIRLAPDNLNIQSNYGLSLALGGHTRQSIALLSKLSQRSRSTLNIKHNLAVAYGIAGQTDKAKQLFEADLDPAALAQNIKILNAFNAFNAFNASKKPVTLKDKSLSNSETQDPSKDKVLLTPPQPANDIIKESLPRSEPTKDIAKPAKKKKKKVQTSTSKTEQVKK
ncbi:MAG: tetratricopeptide repeat protein [Janthinobacterium lividum]